jgi:hypothetical protein
MFFPVSANKNESLLRAIFADVKAKKRSVLRKSNARNVSAQSVLKTKSKKGMLMNLRKTVAAFVVVLMCAGFAAHAESQNEVNLTLGQAKINVLFLSAAPEKIQQRVMDWISNSVRAVATYYGQFPVSRLEIRVGFFEGNGFRGGKSFQEQGLITIAVGLSTEQFQFDHDWIMPHEMVHLAFPDVAENQQWIEEGLATYVEPVARARIGELPAEKVWSDLVHDMPQGLPQEGDQGLDFTPTWGRIYWGGALFCLLADVEIRKRTGNEKGLEHALRAIMKECGADDCDVVQAFEIGDRATGVPVLQELYGKMKAEPVPVDLEELWKSLGVERKGRSVVFNEAAPLAPVRKAILQPVPTSEIPKISHQGAKE